MAKRIFFYITGFIIGAIFVYFLLMRGKSFDFWMPGERVKTELIERKAVLSDKATCQLQCLAVTDSLNGLIRKGNVNFKESRVHDKPCKYYLLDDKADNIRMEFSICDTVATLIDVSREGVSCDCD